MMMLAGTDHAEHLILLDVGGETNLASARGHCQTIASFRYDVKSWTPPPPSLSVMAKVADSHTWTWRQW